MIADSPLLVIGTLCLMLFHTPVIVSNRMTNPTRGKMTEVKDKQTISIYKKYLSEDDSSELNIKEFSGESNRVGLSSNMGYISSVEDARNYLENIFKDTKDTKDT